MKQVFKFSPNGCCRLRRVPAHTLPHHAPSPLRFVIQQHALVRVQRTQSAHFLRHSITSFASVPAHTFQFAIPICSLTTTHASVRVSTYSTAQKISSTTPGRASVSVQRSYRTARTIFTPLIGHRVTVCVPIVQNAHQHKSLMMTCAAVCVPLRHSAQ